MAGRAGLLELSAGSALLLGGAEGTVAGMGARAGGVGAVTVVVVVTAAGGGATTGGAAGAGVPAGMRGPSR